jgi:histidyl-tRNA synthetase
MAKGKQISPDIQWAAIRLSEIMDVSLVAAYCDLGQRSVRRILSYFDQHNDIKHAQPVKQLTKDRSALHRLADYDVEVGSCSRQ